MADKAHSEMAAATSAVFASDRSRAEAGALRDVARAGTSGATTVYPYASRIRAAFGRFAPERLEAAISPAATCASAALSARGVTYGHLVAFRGRPSLSTAAHEAAHVVGAERGVRLPGDVGHHGDRHETIANRAAAAVTQGRSAEPILAESYGDAPATAPAAPLVQMDNEIDTSSPKTKYTLTETPWSQISKQLKLKDELYSIRNWIEVKGGGNLISALGNHSERPESVLAKIDGKRPGKKRSGNTTQSAIGQLGQFMAHITATPLPEKFEGGHLVSDEILGRDSYEEYNLAPQQRSLNSPSYRKIETLAKKGAQKIGGAAPAPFWNYYVWVDYRAPTFDVPTNLICRQLQIPDDAIGANPVPTDITLNTWVPSLWQAQLTTTNSSKYNFRGRSQLDLKSKRGAAKHWVEGEANVLKRARPTTAGVTPDTEEYVDSMAFSMDTMKAPQPGSKKRRTRDEPEHTYTSVQSTPSMQSKLMSGTVLSRPFFEALPSLSNYATFGTGTMGFGGGGNAHQQAEQAAKSVFNVDQALLDKWSQSLFGHKAEREDVEAAMWGLQGHSKGKPVSRRKVISRARKYRSKHPSAGKRSGAQSDRERTAMAEMFLANLAASDRMNLGV